MAAIKALQQWCKQQCDGYRDVSITNMTTSFRDGLAFCAILHKHRPDLIDFNSLSKENVYENNHLAFRVAEEQLGIPALLDAEDMVKLRVPDRLSILTYVSQYYNYFHGRSPIGGIAAVKRPPPDTIEEPAGKKMTNHVAPNPDRTPMKQPPQRSPAPIENAPVRAGIREINPNSEVSSNCSVCGKHVHLVQRHMADGKLYHRNCFRCKQCTRTLQPGSYKLGDQPGTLICKHHSSHTHSPTINSVSTSGPYSPAVSSVGGNTASPSATTRPSTTTNNNPWQRTTSPPVPVPNNRTSVGFVNNNKTSITNAADQEPGNKNSYKFQSTIIKDGPGSANTTNPEPTNRTAVGFYGNTKANSNLSAASGVTEQHNKPTHNHWGASKDRTVSNPSGSVAHLQQATTPTAGYLQTVKGKIENGNSPVPQNNAFQREAKKELGHIGQQGKISATSGNIPSGPSLSAARSPAAIEEAKEQNTTPKPCLSSTTKNKEARDAFFQLKPVTESSANKSPSGRESPKISMANGPGRSVAINVTPHTPVNTEKVKVNTELVKFNTEKDKVNTVQVKVNTEQDKFNTQKVKVNTEQNKVNTEQNKVNTEQNKDNTEKDKARNYLLKNIPGSTPLTPVRSSEGPNSISTPNRTIDPPQRGTPNATPKTEPVKPVPKERKSKLPPSVSTHEPPKTTPTASVAKGPSTPSSDKSSVPAQPTHPTQPSVVNPGRVQKVEEPSPKKENPAITVPKSEAPEAWRSMLKSVDKKPLIHRTLHEAKPTPKEPETTAAQKKPTTFVTVTISPSPAGKENNPVPPKVPAVKPSPVVTESANVTPPKKKLLPAKIDLINDWPKPEQKWQDGAVVTEGEAPTWRSHFSTDKTSTATPSNPSLVENNNLASPSKLRPEYIPEEAIQKQLQIIEQELDTLEQHGVELEKQLRDCDGDESEDLLMVEWFKLIHKKQLLLREESELNYISKQQALENQQQDVETELRNLMNKPEHLKSHLDKAREKQLLDKYILIVNDRSEIIECLDEDRLREKEEDEVMANMIKKHSDSKQKQPSPEPNLKRRSRLSFSGWLKPKDKNKT
ncbi:MICAL-like protein 2 [Pseudophryne corroboree]|uniref:MICAL-like protein 2 n=1 Tax=Pseudophryne corroboree TaxID=495146 RepID=UPI003081CD44